MLLIDDRAGSDQLMPLLLDIAQKVRLEAGDAAWLGNGPEGPFTFPCGLEYKTVTEAIQCMNSKRFVAEQFPKMTERYKRIYLMIEGEYKEGPDGTLVVPVWKSSSKVWNSHGWQTTYRQFDNWLNSLTETGKVIVKYPRDRQQAACQIRNLYYFWTKDYNDHSSLMAFDKSQIPPLVTTPSLVRLWAKELPGVGWKKSGTIDEFFTSPQQLANAGEETWIKIPGIGKQLAKKIVAAITSLKSGSVKTSENGTH